jgi:hypothetical protein
MRDGLLGYEPAGDFIKGSIRMAIQEFPKQLIMSIKRPRGEPINANHTDDAEPNFHRAITRD